jgi:hypothetical protein
VAYYRNLLPSNLDLTSHNKAGLHQTFQKSLVEFLCTDLLIEFLCTDFDGNLSFTLNPNTDSKLDHFLLTLPEELSETANEDEEFDQHFWNENKKCKHRFINEIVAIALSATQFPLSIFTNYSTRGLKSIQCWSQYLKYYSSFIFKWR